MRLTTEEVAAIKASPHEAFGPGAVVRLFGSRSDDARRGGNIDLDVQVSSAGEIGDAPARFRQLLDRRVGEREYDILVLAPEHTMPAIDRKALAEGVVL